MKVLVLAERYSTKDKVSQGFIHTRDLEYIKNGIDLDVISFASKIDNYVLDGINVYSSKKFNEIKNIEDYDIVISHAPNLKHHCKFLNKNYSKIKKIIFFFHGHEVLYSKEIYPKPYDYVKKENKLKEILRDSYDIYKIKYLTKFFKKWLDKSNYIFVSEWMYDQFRKNIKINESEYKSKSHIIYNVLGEVFLNNSYNKETKKEYDFITIRNMLDGSKYCIDVVNRLAKENTNFKFLVIGKGDFFKHNEAPKNLKYELKNLNHKEIIKYLNNARCALMPTRADAQGVMMCEMATFGIPVITSDIFVCQKVLGDLPNVELINNDDNKINLTKILSKLENKKYEKNNKFSYENTILKEIKVFESLLEETVNNQ